MNNDLKNNNPLLDSGLQVVACELKALETLAKQLDNNFIAACQSMLDCKGRIVVLGMGKSGHIGRKIAATLSSTGTPALFVHPAEASHGDMGMITKDDLVLAISNSGNAAEIITLLPLLKRLGAPLISIGSKPNAVLAQAADIHLNIGDMKEACPMNLAPTSSTTATLVLGDALAIALLEARGYSEEAFAFTHPGGMLGKRLLLRVEDLMHTGEHIPVVQQDKSIMEALTEITAKGFGITAVVGDSGKLVGVFTDGDLRRAVDSSDNIKALKLISVMGEHPVSVPANQLAAEALRIMEQKKIMAVFVVNEQQKPIGVIHMHDMLRSGLA